MILLDQTIFSKEVTKVSASSSGKIDRYEYLTDEQANFTYSLLGNALEKQIKSIEDQGRIQVEALKDLKPEKIQQDLKSIE